MKFPLGHIPANRRVDPHTIVDLLREMPDMTLADVGRRVGLSKERIRQIAGDIPGASRHKRRRVCSVCGIGVKFRDGQGGYAKGYCPEHWKEVSVHKRELRRSLHWPEFTCERCGAKFSRRLSEVKRAKKLGLRIRFCSRACYNDYLRDSRWPEFTCERCGTKFFRRLSQVKRVMKIGGRIRFCSRVCCYDLRDRRCVVIGKIMLNLGAGERERIPGFTNVDIRPLPNVDIVASVDKLGMFGDNSVALVYASHILEHFGRNDTERVLREWHRVLKPGGILRLAVPDFEKVVEVYQKTKDLKLLLGHLVGGQDYPANLHRMVFDFGLLSELLARVGFGNIRRYDWRQTIHKDYDDYSQAYWPHMDKEHGTLMSLNVEAEK